MSPLVERKLYLGAHARATIKFVVQPTLERKLLDTLLALVDMGRALGALKQLHAMIKDS